MATAGLARCGGPAALRALAGVRRGDPERYLQREADWAMGEVRARMKRGRA